MKSTILVISFLLVCLNLFGQNEISIKINDLEGKPIEQAIIFYDGIKFTSDKNGSLTIKYRVGVDSILVRKKVGYSDTLKVLDGRSTEQIVLIEETKLFDNFGKLVLKEYYPNGQLKCREKFKDSKKIGKWVYYYENGSIKLFGRYKDGKREGFWNYTDKNNVVNKLLYKEGVYIM
ncbi:toxin-antitoxin system YwqK family antitoxin [Flammeovirga agarivorans]|uniref:MORN repeat variant n=1 Tax=Flammeovirga agarivorans TaxID=2726742 RepID=A0A7X8SRP5_9BACT|nr:hypothetical protein [Flammeovirga agarivorans]NLR95033.1 hypothetical protein [Flammeovirga agarivorans]